LLTKQYSDEKIKEDETGGHGGHVEEKRDAYSFFAEPEKRDHLENIGVEGRRILKWIVNK